MRKSEVNKVRLTEFRMNREFAATIVLLAITVVGCAKTMQPISGTESSTIHVSIAVGDTVRVLTKYGDRQTFKVSKITEETLDGEVQSIRYTDMAFVEKRVRAVRNENEVAAHAILVLIGGAVAVQSINGIEVPAVFGAP